MTDKRPTGVGLGMTEAFIQKKKSEGDQEIVLRLLEQVEADASVSQDRFAKRVGIAKGLANAYFNRCLQKGWIKLRQVPKQRFLYYVTPKGLAEKARLTAQFLTYSYRFYRQARGEMVALMAEAASLGHRRLVILGSDELAEIAAIVSGECPIEIVGFIDPGNRRQRIGGRLVLSEMTGFANADGAVLATHEEARFVFEAFQAERPALKIFVPPQLQALLWEGRA